MTSFFDEHSGIWRIKNVGILIKCRRRFALPTAANDGLPAQPRLCGRNTYRLYRLSYASAGSIFTPAIRVTFILATTT